MLTLARKERKWRQDDLAERMGINRQTIARMEAGMGMNIKKAVWKGRSQKKRVSKTTEKEKMWPPVLTVIPTPNYLSLFAHIKQGLDAIAESGGTPSIPARSGTTTVSKNPSPGEVLRNRLLQEIRTAGGRIAWKKTLGHHCRSLAETHLFRLKTILGGTLRGRNFANQKTEAKIMAKILNKMVQLGMPRSEKRDV